MNKKILTGSIIAVAILVGVSFTSVVGYGSVKYTSGEASPLFNIRLSRNVDEESRIVKSDYIGKGEESSLSINKLNEKQELIRRFIDRISKMNDRTFHKYIFFIINQMRQKNIFTNEKIPELTNVLYQIRTNSELMANDIYHLNDIAISDTYHDLNTLTTVCFWFPGCIPYVMFWGFIACLLLFIMYLWELFPTTEPCCESLTCTYIKQFL